MRRKLVVPNVGCWRFVSVMTVFVFGCIRSRVLTRDKALLFMQPISNTDVMTLLFGMEREVGLTKFWEQC